LSETAAPLNLTKSMSDIMLRTFARRLRARYTPQFALTTDIQVGLLRLARADLQRLPKAHRCSA
jgi:hypothetical protein